MLKINKKVEYALMCLKFMSQKRADELTSAREVCEKFHTPFDTTAKVMQTLNHHGILSSVKGIKGGYRLERALEDISYMEVSELIDGKKSEVFCQGHKGLCELYQTCNIVTPVELLDKKIRQFLHELSLAELFNGHIELVLAESTTLRSMSHE